MDLLLPSPAWASPSIRVPFFDGFHYAHGSGSFERPDIAVHRAGTSAHITSTQINVLRTRDRAAFLQAWLFIGLFSAFFDREVLAEWFARSDTTGEYAVIVVVDPTIVEAMVGEWSRSLEKLAPSSRAAAIDHAILLLSFASDQCDMFDLVRRVEHKEDESEDVQALSRVLLSIRLAIAFLRSSTQAVAQKSRIGDAVAKALRLVDTAAIDNEWGKVLAPTPPGGQPPLSVLPLLDQFDRNRWCPIRARRLCEQYDYTVISYLARVPRLDPSNVTHATCGGGTRCKAYDFDEARQSSYQSKHATAGCQCSEMGVSSEKLATIIAKGGIPILSMDPVRPNEGVQVHKYNGNRRYTAISHVWSDGLGNPHRNALPFCQIQRIGQVLANLKARSWRFMYWEEKLYSMYWLNPSPRRKRRVYFWMDTLCIPVQVAPESSLSVKELKQLAIRHITPIFEVADQVLVLDAELEKLALKSPDDDEMTADQVAHDEEALAARILGCKWLQRAWTLEEGSLSNSCQFKVADATTTIDLGELLPTEQCSGHFWRQRRRKAFWKQKRKTDAHATGGRLLSQDVETGYKGAGLAHDNTSTSTLQRSTPHFDTPLKLLLAGSLNENRKQAMRHGFGGKYAKQFQKSRGLQFIEAWNELLSRSATKPNDSLIIMANILDFNSASIAQLKPADLRLPTLICNSREVPLGLLFNTSNHVRFSKTPKDSWMPTAIDGDRLTGSAMLTRETPNENFRLGLSACKGTLRAFIVRNKIPFGERCVVIETAGPMGTGEQYIVETHPPPNDAQAVNWLQQLQASYDEGDSTSCLLLLDFTSGSSSTNGYACRGALLNVLNGTGKEKELLVRYSTPTTIWTWEQWSERGNVSMQPNHTFHAEPVARDYTIFIDSDSGSALPVQRQRELLKPFAHNVRTKIGWYSVPFGMILSAIVFYGLVPQCGYLNTLTGEPDSKLLSEVHLQRNTTKPLDSVGRCRLISEGVGLPIDLFLPLVVYFVWKFWRSYKYRRWLRTFTIE